MSGAESKETGTADLATPLPTASEGTTSGEPKNVASEEPAASKAAEDLNDNTTPAPDADGGARVEHESPATATAPTSKASTPYDELLAALPDLLKQADYHEVYGITLDASGDVRTSIILQKFLRANANDLVKAEEQLLETLKWRKQFDPLSCKNEVFSKERFDGLGYVIESTGVTGSTNSKDVVTFNIYGGVKNNKLTFQDIPGFIRWRVGLMELGLSKLDIASATEPIPAYGEGPDPYQGIQVHDYLNVSFLRQDPYVKKASKAAIDTFSKYYPETLSRKFFVNVPAVMGWLFSAFKLVLSKETVKKFTVLSYGDQLVTELGKDIPKVYGGEKGELQTIGEALQLK